MNHLSKITASREAVESLIKYGIIPQGGDLWHCNSAEGWELCELEDGEYSPGFCLPAWSKEEIDVMIGGEFNMLANVRARARIHTAELPPGMNHDEYWPGYFVVYYPEKEITYSKGADAAAGMLEYLLTTGMVKPGACNMRYQAVYKQEKV